MSLTSLQGGCIIVDSTRKGKRFPDSMSKTIPIWTCVLNRAILNYLRKMYENGQTVEADATDGAINEKIVSWDCSLHLPLWVSKIEKAAIEDRLEEWTKQLEDSGADIGFLASLLGKPLRPLWISPKTIIWLNEVPDCGSWDFTPIILVSASSPSGIIQQRTTSEFSWLYISGAGDDEESWARGLSPNLFWRHAYNLISSGPDSCNQKVADIVEKNRVYRAQRGENAPQVVIKPQKFLMVIENISDEESLLHLETLNNKIDVQSCGENYVVSWLGSTNIAVGTTELAQNLSNVDCILNCDLESITLHCQNAKAYLHLPILNSKLDRFSLLNNLPGALNFARLNLCKGKTLLVCCHNGEDISICVCLAILIALFDDGGTFDDGKSFNELSISKWELRRRLVFICKFAVNARPSRGNLKQVFGFLTKGTSIMIS